MGLGGGGQRSILAGEPPVYYRTYSQKPEGLLSPEEKKNLTVAIAALTAALTMALLGGVYGLLAWYEDDPFYVGYIALVAFVSTATAFFLHEMAHKFVAQHYGCWAEFRYSQQGLIIAVALAAFAGFLFAAPGAVYIAGRIDQRQNGIISIAGPLTNVVVVLAALPIIFIYSGTLVASGFYTVIFFNAFLAIFNMIPVMPLDGAKVLKWNPAIYVAGIALMGILLLYVMVYLPGAVGLT
jgi:Zn-dependent protease